VAELPAGSLTIDVGANIGPLEKGLNRAQQKVVQADQQIGQAAQQAQGGFFEAAGAVQGFQSKLSAALGVVAGFAAVGAIVGGVAQGFSDAAEAVEGANDNIDAFDKGVDAVFSKIPVFNQFAAAGRQLAIALGLAADEAKELAEATARTNQEQAGFKVSGQARVKIAQNEIDILKQRGRLLEADNKAAELAFDQQIAQAQALRVEAAKNRDSNSQVVKVLQSQADELERQARIQRALAENQARIDNEKRVSEQIKETNRLMDEAQQMNRARNEAIAEVLQTGEEELEIARLRLELAQTSDEVAKNELQTEIDRLQIVSKFESELEAINALFDERKQKLEEVDGASELLAENEAKRQQAQNNLFLRLRSEQLRKQLEDSNRLAKAQQDQIKKQQEEERKADEERRKAFSVRSVGETAIGAFKFALAASPSVKTGESKADQEAPKQTQVLEAIETVLNQIKQQQTGGALT
tara:strand:+ start:902 stop:2308 length:1407 start_codon:yes stop_codon:yes gene_type:complete